MRRFGYCSVFAQARRVATGGRSRRRGGVMRTTAGYGHVPYAVPLRSEEGGAKCRTTISDFLLAGSLVDPISVRNAGCEKQMARTVRSGPSRDELQPLATST